MKPDILLVLLIFAASSFAMEIKPIEERETAAVGSNHFNISITYDCNRTMTFSIKSEGAAVKDANVFVFYEERYTSLLGTGKTDADGRYAYTIIGNPDNMRDLFLATVEKSGFRTKEVHFILPQGEDCIEQNKTAENVPANLTAGNSRQNESLQVVEEDAGQTAEKQSNGGMQDGTEKENHAADAGTAEKTAEKADGEQNAGTAFCSPALLLAVFLFVIIRRRSSRI